jgi:hypothetical protein
MAMKIAKCATLEELSRHRDPWAAFSSEIGVSATYIRRRVAALSDAARAQVPGTAEETARPGLDASALTRFSALITSRAERVAQLV